MSRNDTFFRVFLETFAMNQSKITNYLLSFADCRQN